MGVPVLLFGYAAYKYLGCVHYIDSQNSCNKSVKKILDNEKPNKMQLKQYLLALDEVSISATVDAWFLDGDKVNLNENAAQLSVEMVKKLKKNIKNEN